MSRARQSSHQGSHVLAKKADAAARLASKRAEINREQEIAAQRKEVLAQQERLKMLESQKDLEAIEAEYSVYAEEESKLNVETGDTRKKDPLPLSQLPAQHSSVSHPKVSHDVSARPCSESKYAQVTQSVPVHSCFESGPKVEPKENEASLIPKPVSRQGEASLVQALKESLVMTRLSAPEPFIFSGDPLKFIEWSTSFKALIEQAAQTQDIDIFSNRTA